MQYSTTLFDLADRYRRFSAVNRARPRAKRTEHRQILDAALERDADLAVVLLRRHIEATARNVTDALNRAAPREPGAKVKSHDVPIQRATGVAGVLKCRGRHSRTTLRSSGLGRQAL